MTDFEKIKQVEYKSHLLQVKTCKMLMDQMCVIAGSDGNWEEQARALRDLSVAVANVGGRVPQ